MPLYAKSDIKPGEWICGPAARFLPLLGDGIPARIKTLLGHIPAFLALLLIHTPAGFRIARARRVVAHGTHARMPARGAQARPLRGARAGVEVGGHPLEYQSKFNPRALLKN